MVVKGGRGHLEWDDSNLNGRQRDRLRWLAIGGNHAGCPFPEQVTHGLPTTVSDVSQVGDEVRVKPHGHYVVEAPTFNWCARPGHHYVTSMRVDKIA